MLLEKLKIHIDNPGLYSMYQPCITQSSEIIESYSPIDNQFIANVKSSDLNDVDHILQIMNAAQKPWQATPAPKRAELIKKFILEIQKRKKYLAELITLETGKSLIEAHGEIQEMLDIGEYAIGLARMFGGRTLPSERPDHRIQEIWHPLGIVSIITAFNFPMAVWSWNAFIAAICGNIVLWKPSSQTPLCAIALQQIAIELANKNNYPSVFNLIISKEHHVVDKIVENHQIKLVSFTGSTKIGIEIAKKVAGRLGRSILELGGNNAVIIDKTANIEQALSAAYFGAIGTAGQRCTSTRRLIIHEEIWEIFIKKLIEKYKKTKIGDPRKPINNMGPLINVNAQNLYNDLINKIKKINGQIIYGGKSIISPGFFVEPTLVSNIDYTHDLINQENFVPVVYLFKFKKFPDAIKIHNYVPQGLSSALFSNDHNNIEYYLSYMGSDCGMANINTGTSGAEIGCAFGGEKLSGLGREAGIECWKNYSFLQSSVINISSTKLSLSQGIVF